MRLIDADALIERMKNDNPQTSKIKWLQILAHSAPTIDAVEGIRCKECTKHGMSNCYMWGNVTTDDWMWCCDGERREDDQE